MPLANLCLPITLTQVGQYHITLFTRKIYQSVRGANKNVPIPDPQMARPVTNGLFLVKY